MTEQEFLAQLEGGAPASTPAVPTNYTTDIPLIPQPIPEQQAAILSGPKQAQDWGEYRRERAKQVLTGKGLADITSLLSPELGGKIRNLRRMYLDEREILPPEGEMTGFKKALNEALVAPLDPLTYVGTGGVPAKIGEAVSGTLGAESASYIADLATEGNKAAMVGAGILGGIKGASINAPVARTATTLAGKAVGLASKVPGMVKGAEDTIDEAAADVANERVRTLLAAAVRADPSLANDIAAATQTASKYGAKLPILATVDNDVIRKKVEELFAKDVKLPNGIGFRTQYKADWDAANNALAQAKTSLFGDPTVAAAKAFTPRAVQAQKSAQVRLDKIDNAVANTVSKLSKPQDTQALGMRVEELLDAKERVAKDSVAPEYTAAFDIAKSKGLMMPEESVRDIYQFANDEMYKDIFKSFPTLYSKVKTVFRPVKGEGVVQETVDGLPVLKKQQVDTFEPRSVEDLDSLKREVNSAIRKNKNPDMVYPLQELRNRVQKAIVSVGDEDFVKQYKKADQLYAERVGVPFSQEAIRAIDSKKFAENVVPVLTMNKSALSEFLAVTGGDGVDLVKDAFYHSLYKSAAMKDGVINPTSYRNWLKQNENTLSLLPELKKEFQSGMDVAVRAKEVADKVRQHSIRVKGADIISDVGSREQVLSALKSQPYKVDQFVKNYAKDEESLQAVRSIALDDILRSKDPVQELSVRGNDYMYKRLFGPQYIQQVKDLADITRRVQAGGVDRPLNIELSIPKDAAEKAIGMSYDRIFSLWNQFVRSLPSKVAVLTGTATRYRAGVKADEEAARLFSDPNLVALALKASNPDEAAKIGVSDLKRAIDYMIGISGATSWTPFRGAYIGGKVAGQEQQEQERQGETPMGAKPMTEEEFIKALE